MAIADWIRIRYFHKITGWIRLTYVPVIIFPLTTMSNYSVLNLLAITSMKITRNKMHSRA